MLQPGPIHAEVHIAVALLCQRQRLGYVSVGSLPPAIKWDVLCSTVA